MRTPRPRARPLNIYGLNAVDCARATDCWAVGLSMTSPASFQPLFEHWNGRAWAIVPTPATGGVDEPLGVTCLTGTNCWAVGYSFVNEPCCGFVTLVRHWDGRRWTTTRSPNPARGSTTDVPENYLRAVSCVSTRDCWAVGYTSDGERYSPLRLHWDGVRWTATVDSSATTSSGALLGVSCTGQSGCWTVGVQFASAGVAADPQPLIEHWHAGAWSTSAPTLPVAADEGQLTAVACGSSSDCTAVGYAANPVTGAWATLVERWTGSRWTRVAAPSPGTAPDTLLWGVSCPATRTCTAVGGYPNALGTPQPMAVQLTGTAWRSTQASLAVRVGGVLTAVTCITRSDCWAVGYDIADDRALTEHWNGRRWGVSPTPMDRSSSFEQLYGIACPTTDECWAVGWSARDRGSPLLALRWDGRRWAAASVPDLPGASGEAAVDGGDITGYLQGIACPSKSDCWAVGSEWMGTNPTALLEHWDGTSWRPSVGAGPAVADGGLTGVTCTAATSCWAVGRYSVAAATLPLVEHFDGTAWAMQPTPLVAGSTNTVLLNVACSTSSTCWAVGGSADQAGELVNPLIERWDSTSWQVVPSPSIGGTLYNIACSRSGSCWAVGWTVAGTGFGTVMRGLVETETGNRWATSASAALPRTDTADVLDGIGCVPHAQECWATGEWVDRQDGHTLVEHATLR